MAEAAPGAEDDGAQAGVLGLLGIGGVAVALPLQVLREVVPCPDELAGLPTAAEGLLGAVVVREMVLPVLDLRPSMGLPAERTGQQVVVVVAHGGRVVGLLADEVRGVTHVPRESRFETSAVSSAPDGVRALCFSHTFTDPADGGVVSVLDAEALLRRPGVPTVVDIGRTGVELGAHGTVRPAGRTHTVLRLGTRLLALDVRFVHTTVPGVRPRRSVVDSDVCRGVSDFAGREVAVVDILALLGLGRLPDGPCAPAPGAGLVLDLGVGYVVLAVEQLLDLHEIADSDVLPLPALAAGRADLVAGLAQTGASEPCLVLDGEALRREADLLSLARANTTVEHRAARGREPTPGTSPGPSCTPTRASHGVTVDTGAAGADGPAAGAPYLTYRAGERLCSPLAQVVEVLPVPDGVVSAGGSDVVVGVCAHRGEAVPLVRLSTLLGGGVTPVTSASCLLLVPVDGGGPDAPGRSGVPDDVPGRRRHVGFMVDGLEGIDPLRWAEPGRPAGDAARAGTVPPDPLHGAPVVRLGEDPRLVASLDLRALATGLTSPARPVAASAPGPRSSVPGPRQGSGERERGAAPGPVVPA